MTANYAEPGPWAAYNLRGQHCVVARCRYPPRWLVVMFPDRQAQYYCEAHGGEYLHGERSWSHFRARRA